MNNLNYFPFERPQYYYGKLLTEQDFNQEQQYMNDKRRLCNRFGQGLGVLAGLDVTRVDEKNIAISDGVALDFAGREMVLKTPLVCNLSGISGFHSEILEKQVDFIYLCMEYEEVGAGAIPSFTPNFQEQGEGQGEVFEKSVETYKLYLTTQPPLACDLGPSSLGEQELVLLEHPLLQITQRFPKFPQAGRSFQSTLCIRGKSQGVQYRFTLAQALHGGSIQGEDSLKRECSGVLAKEGDCHLETFDIAVKGLEFGSFTDKIAIDSLEINKVMTKSPPTDGVDLLICHQDPLASLERAYFSQTMEGVQAHNYPRGIHLAKLHLMKVEKSYYLERVTPLPFGQHAYSNHLLASMVKQLHQTSQLAPHLLPSPSRESAPANGSRVERVTDVVEIPLHFSSKKGQKFFSHPITHPFGLGPFQVQVAIQDNNLLYQGQGDLFSDNKIKAQLGVKLNMAEASFVLGVKLLEPTEQRKLVLRYWLEKVQEEKTEATPHLYILPGRLDLKLRESHHLEAVCEEMASPTILWSIQDNAQGHHGAISSDGTYTAPNTPGIYEIIATCQEDRSLRASIFIIVRE